MIVRLLLETRTEVEALGEAEVDMVDFYRRCRTSYRLIKSLAEASWGRITGVARVRSPHFVAIDLIRSLYNLVKDVVEGRHTPILPLPTFSWAHGVSYPPRRRGSSAYIDMELEASPDDYYNLIRRARERGKEICETVPRDVVLRNIDILRRECGIDVEVEVESEEVRIEDLIDLLYDIYSRVRERRREQPVVFWCVCKNIGSLFFLLLYSAIMWLFRAFVFCCERGLPI